MEKNNFGGSALPTKMEDSRTSHIGKIIKFSPQWRQRIRQTSSRLEGVVPLVIYRWAINPKLYTGRRGSKERIKQGEGNFINRFFGMKAKKGLGYTWLKKSGMK